MAMSQARSVLLGAISKVQDGGEVDVDRVAEATIQYGNQLYIVQMFLKDNMMADINDFYTELINAEAYLMMELGQELHRFNERMATIEDDAKFDMEEHASDFDVEEFEEAHRRALQSLRMEVAGPIESLKSQ